MAVKFDTASGTFVVDHDLSADDITRGVLAVARGGTGADGSALAAHLVLVGPPTGGPGPATYRALVAEDLPATAVTAGTYGDATHVPRVVVDAQGRITGVTEVSISAGPPMPTTFVIGDLLYASSTSALSALADVAAGRYLRSGGVGAPPAWSSVSLPNAVTAGDLLYGSSSNTVGTLADVATGQVLTSGGVGVAPAWSSTPSVTTLTGSTSLLTPLLDRASAGTLTIGPTATTVAVKSNNIRLQSAAGGDGLWVVGSTSVTCYAGTFDTPASSITFNWGASTGPFTLSQGNVSWTGAVNSTLSFLASGSSGTMLLQTQGSGAHLSLKTSGTSAYVLLDGTTGVVLRRNSATFADFGNSSSTGLTLGSGISLIGAVGSGGLNLASMTGPSTMPQGDHSWMGMTDANLSLVAQGSNATVTIGNPANYTYIYGGGSSSAPGGLGSLVLNALGSGAGFGVVILRSGSRMVDFGATAINEITVASGKKLTLDAGTATGAAGAVTLNKQVGVVTTEARTTAAGSRTTYTVTNNLVTASSRIMCFLQGGTNTTRPVYLTDAVPGAGSFTVDIENAGAGALNGTIIFMFLVL